MIRLNRYSPVYRLWEGIWNQPVARAGLTLFLVILAFSLVGAVWTPYSPTASAFPPGRPPSLAHPLGTTVFGQDVLSQLMAGGLPVIGIGLGVGAIGTLISLLVGTTSGYYADSAIGKALSWLNQLLLVVPALIFMMFIADYMLALHIRLGYLGLMLVLSVTGWPPSARTIRAQTLTIRRKEFVLSSELIGERWYRVLFDELVPYNLPYIASAFFFNALYGVFSTALIYYLGLGSLKAVNWGTMLYWSLSSYAYFTGEWWWYLPPGLMMGLLALSFALMNVGIDVVANPKLRVWRVPRGLKVVYPQGRA